MMFCKQKADCASNPFLRRTISVKFMMPCCIPKNAAGLFLCSVNVWSKKPFYVNRNRSTFFSAYENEISGTSCSARRAVPHRSVSPW